MLSRVPVALLLCVTAHAESEKLSINLLHEMYPDPPPHIPRPIADIFDDLVPGGKIVMVEKAAEDEVVILEQVGSGETAIIDEIVPASEVDEVVEVVEELEKEGVVVPSHQMHTDMEPGDTTSSSAEAEREQEILENAVSKVQQKHEEEQEKDKVGESVSHHDSKQEHKEDSKQEHTEDSKDGKESKKVPKTDAKDTDKNSSNKSSKESSDTAPDQKGDGEEPSSASSVERAPEQKAKEESFIELPAGITGITADVAKLEAELAESKQMGRAIGISFVVLFAVALVALLVRRWIRARNEKERLRESRYYTNFMNYTLDVDDKDLEDNVNYVALGDDRPLMLA